MTDVKKMFEQVCFERARGIWWAARTAILPSDIINVIAQSDEQYMKLMDEREQVLHDCFFATVNLHTMSREFSEKNSKKELDAACADIRIYASETVEAAKILAEEFTRLENEYRNKKDQSDEVLVKKEEKYKEKRMRNRNSERDTSAQ